MLATRGEWERALADCDEVLKLDPKFSLALAIRAEIRAGCPDEKFRSAKKALQDARQACELTNWKDAAGLMAYAAACAEAGDFAEAARWQVQAMKDEAYMTGHAAHARNRLEMYRNRQPLRLAAEKKSE